MRGQIEIGAADGFGKPGWIFGIDLMETALAIPVELASICWSPDRKGKLLAGVKGCANIRLLFAYTPAHER